MRRAPAGYWEQITRQILNDAADQLAQFLLGPGPGGRAAGPRGPRRLRAPEAKGCPDPYATLGLLPSAPREVVDAAYRALAKLSHPDVTGGSTARMRALTQAMTIIRKERGWH